VTHVGHAKSARSAPRPQLLPSRRLLPIRCVPHSPDTAEESRTPTTHQPPRTGRPKPLPVSTAEAGPTLMSAQVRSTLPTANGQRPTANGHRARSTGPAGLARPNVPSIQRPLQADVRTNPVRGSTHPARPKDRRRPPPSNPHPVSPAEGCAGGPRRWVGAWTVTHVGHAMLASRPPRSHASKPTAASPRWVDPGTRRRIADAHHSPTIACRPIEAGPRRYRGSRSDVDEWPRSAAQQSGSPGPASARERRSRGFACGRRTGGCCGVERVAPAGGLPDGLAVGAGWWGREGGREGMKRV
jgi:hypothetical protein